MPTLKAIHITKSLKISSSTSQIFAINEYELNLFELYRMMQKLAKLNLQKSISCQRTERQWND